MTQYNRREFLGAAALGAAALMAGPATMSAATRRKIPIGVQLWSVRQVFQNDIPGTLAGIKKIGYEGVEFAGYFNYANNAKGLRQLLDDNGLKVCGTHMPGGLQGVTGDQFDKTVEFNKILGNDRLIVASMSAKTAEDWAKQADLFTGLAEKLKPHNMHIGYHNHVAEFNKMADGQIPEYIFFDKASPDVFVQLDIGHCAHGGGDPVAVLKKYSGRVYSVHVKDWVPATQGDIVGEGIVKWPEVLEACEANTGPKWYIVEEESGKFAILDGIAKDYENLTKLLAT